MLQPGAIFELKMHQNAFATWALPGPHCGGGRGLMALPRPPHWFSWGRFAAGERRKGEGSVFPLFYNLATAQH